MNILLIFFAIPLATIILSIIFQTLIGCPFKVAGIAFSIFLIVAFALGGSAALIVAAIVYTIISFLAAFITMIIQDRIGDNNCNNDNDNNNSCNTCSYSCRRFN